MSPLTVFAAEDNERPTLKRNGDGWPHSLWEISTRSEPTRVGRMNRRSPVSLVNYKRECNIAGTEVENHQHTPASPFP